MSITGSWKEMISLEIIEEASRRIRPYIRTTSIVTDDGLNRETGLRLAFKCENQQIGGSFKARGAFNAVFSLSEKEAARGVVTHSSGNHGGALAIAAAARKVPAYIVMPKNAPRAKSRNVEEAGGKIVWCEPTMTSREAVARKLQEETGAVMIHPFDDYRVMAGQGTVGMELADFLPEISAVVVPVSGGGLLSGVAVAIKAMRPECKVIGVEPEGAADGARSFRDKKLHRIENPQTMADGLRAASLGERTFPIICELVDAMVTVSEEKIEEAMRILSDQFEMPVEPSGAVPFAAVLAERNEIKGLAGTIAVLVTGGNRD